MTADINFDKFSMKELRDLQGKLERAISSYEYQRRREALAAIQSTAREFGFNLEELTGNKPNKVGTVKPKYAHPDDPTMTWTGRGRKPRWVIEHLDSGKSLEDMQIE